MRDRLIELIKQGENEFMHSILSDFDLLDYLADYLLANGVIVPPCKIGDDVYVIEDWGEKIKPEQKQVGAIVIEDIDGIIIKELRECAYDGTIGEFDKFGKTVFLNKEEAEQALKGGEG